MSRFGGAVPSLIMVALAAVLLGNGVALGVVSPAGGSPLALGEVPVPTLASVTSTVVDAEAPPPRRVTIERLGVDSTLTGLRVQRDGALQVPEDARQVGWHRAGTAPGDVGPAVLVGHVDSYEGAGVFYRLRELQPGDRVTVTRVDGSTVEFEVYGLETVPKSGFPTDRVYGPSPGPELRLLTCGGTFDEASRSYTDNVVVYARSVSTAVPS